MVVLKLQPIFAIASENKVVWYHSLRVFAAGLTYILITHNSAFADMKPVDSAEPVLTFWLIEGLRGITSAPTVTRYDDNGHPVVSPQDPDSVVDRANNYTYAKTSYILLKKGPAASSFKSVILNRDSKSVTVVLNENDRKALADLTREFQGQYLYCFGSYPEQVFFHITAPIEDGIFEFSSAKSKASGDMAEYLRKRFRLGESKS